MLLSTVLPILSVYRLPHGQYGYRHSNELYVLLVRKEGSSASHRDFRVRRSVVLRALQWLKTNNIYYKDVKIDMDKLRQLPEDGDLTGLSTVMMEMSINEDTTTEQEDPHAANLTTSFIPITNQNNARRREKLAQESKEEREERLSKRNARDRARRAEKRRTVEQNEPQEKRPRLTLASFLPTFGDCKVQDTLKKFHMEMSTITVATCSTCQESFPGMVMVPRHGECTRCSRDRGTPKLYSEENNMHPGAIPSQLKV